MRARCPAFLVLLAAVAWLACGCKEYRGSVRDSETKKALPDAMIQHAGQVVRSDKGGEFVLRKLDQAQPLRVKAAGYRYLRMKLPEKGSLTADLEPLEARGVYLSYNSLGKPEVRGRVLSWLGPKRLNTLVVDIKDERGRMTFYNGAPRAGQMGAFGAVKIEDITSFLNDLHRRGVYVVGRMSVFKDSVLAEHNPAWSVKTKGRSNLFWLDPFCQEAWNYNLGIAKEAAADGFDELQLDNVRFPTGGEVPEPRYSRSDSSGNRASAITGFWREARRQLAAFDICLSQGGPTAGYPGPAWNDPNAQPDYLALQPGSGRGWAGAAGDKGGRAKLFRPYLPCGNTVADINLPAAVATCREAGTSGWVLFDPAGTYDISGDIISKLGPKEE